MKILVCDDDTAVVSMVRFKFSRENFGDVSTAADGKEAFQLLSENEYDMILTDIYMPFHFRLEVIDLVRNVLKKKTPILILSDEGLEDTVLQAFQLGADDFVAKPFSLAELTLRVKRLIH